MWTRVLSSSSENLWEPEALLLTSAEFAESLVSNDLSDLHQSIFHKNINCMLISGTECAARASSNLLLT